MKLTLEGIQNRKEWEEKGYSLPQYDIAEMRKATKENPFWIHFGAGNLFRAFHANVVQNMLNNKDLDRGLIVAEGFDYEIIEKMYVPHDNLGIVATLKADGTIDKTVVASVAESLPLDSNNESAYARLKEIFTNKSLQMATFTITEKGYSLVNGKGEQLPDITADFVNGPEKPASYMGKVTSLLYARFKAGELPIAMVSTDNCSHNGDKLYAAILAFAKAWTENGKAEKEFVEYIDSNKVSFTWSMIDKITPRPDASVEKILLNDGVEELDPVITSKNTYVAPFVNAEETEYLVIEDDFPNGRLDLTKGGLMFTDRDTVDKVEKMKVCTCLNPLHTCLAIFGCVLGYNKISDEMKDEELVKLVDENVQISIMEVKNPDVDAALVAENIAHQIENRVSFRIAQKRAIRNAMKAGAKGIKTSVSGRLGGADMARTEFYKEGTIPLQTLRADIDYGFAEANTTYGKIGVKTWIYHGEVLPTKGKKPAKASSKEGSDK